MTTENGLPESKIDILIDQVGRLTEVVTYGFVEIKEANRQLGIKLDQLGDRIEQTIAGIKETNVNIKETNANIKETNVNIKETNANIKETNTKLDEAARVRDRQIDRLVGIVDRQSMMLEEILRREQSA
ncbi:hypothetical protein ACKFKF_27805 [Phormidesmis sp. 146-12]